MTGGAECVGENASVLDAAKRLSELDVGSAPICGEDDRLKGMITDRDIVIEVLAKGKDPSDVKVSELANGEDVTIGADDSIEEALKAMAGAKVRRLPVIDGHDLIGVVSVAVLAGEFEYDKVGVLVDAISATGG